MSDGLDEFVEIVKDNNEEINIQKAIRANNIVEEPVSEKDLSAKRTSNASMWSVAGAGSDFFPSESSVKELPPGQYTVKHAPSVGIYFSKRDINLDNLLVLPDSNSERVLNHIKDFWGNEESFRKYGFLWKRGIMLWGPPGSGKTSTVQQLSKQIVDLGGITVYCVEPNLIAAGLDILRKIEPKRPLICIFEDIDAIVNEYGESEVLAMLDGELQIDNVVFVATTNYPQRLDKRFINRPSRFDEIIKIGMPSPEARKYYLEHKNPRLKGTNELNKWVELSKGFSVAHLKEMIISVECFNKTIEDAAKRLRSMMEATPDYYSDDGTKRKIGF